MSPIEQPSVSEDDLDAIAWMFLRSEFANEDYASWPLERRVEAYLRRRGPQNVLDHGSAYDALVERVMANVGRAVHSGVLASSHG
jgi:hypothetical protein